MRSKILFVIIVITILITSCSGLTKEKIIEKTQKSINNIKTYQSRVEVEIFGNNGSQLYQIEQAYKEGAFRLETISPSHLAGKVVIIKDNRAKIYHPSFEQSIIIENFTQNREEFMFLGDFITWNIQGVDEVQEETREGQKYYVFTKEFDEEGNIYHHKLSVWVDKKIFLPKYIEIFDIKGNIRVKINILDLKVNHSIEDQLFTQE